MDAMDKAKSKFYLITEILGKDAKHFDKVTISMEDIPIMHKKTVNVEESPLVESFERKWEPIHRE